MQFSLPRPLRRLQAYAQREEIANRLFNGRLSSGHLQASVPTIQSLAAYGGVPEVVLMGRANTGKSTIINGVFRRRGLADVGQTAGGTQCLNFFRLANNVSRGQDLILVDAPGYGDRGRPEWGRLFDYYIDNRRELRQVCIVINVEHGVTKHDKLMFEHLAAASQSRGFSLQPILSKCDKVPRPLLPQVIAHRTQAISECLPSHLPVITTGAGFQGTFGFGELRKSILETCGLIEPLAPPLFS